jgi:hypothetical protein
MLFVFVITDTAIGNDILDLLTGREAAALAAVEKETAALVTQAEGINLNPPPKPGA